MRLKMNISVVKSNYRGLQLLTNQDEQTKENMQPGWMDWLLEDPASDPIIKLFVLSQSLDEFLAKYCSQSLMSSSIWSSPPTFAIENLKIFFLFSGALLTSTYLALIRPSRSQVFLPRFHPEKLLK